MYKLLIVDDERVIRMGLKKAIDWEQAGIGEVLTADSAFKALELIHLENPDLMITDINMAEMSGLELMEQIRKEGNEIPVLILTGYDRFEYAREALQYHAVDFLLKPVDEDKLLRSVIKELDLLEERRENKLESFSQRAVGVRRQMLLETTVNRLVRGIYPSQEDKNRFVREICNWNTEFCCGYIVPKKRLAEEDTLTLWKLTVKALCVAALDNTRKGLTACGWEQGIILLFFYDKDNEIEDTAESLVHLVNEETGVEALLYLGDKVNELGKLQFSFSCIQRKLTENIHGRSFFLTDGNEQQRKEIFEQVYSEFRKAIGSLDNDKSQVLHILYRFNKAIESYEISDSKARKYFFELSMNALYSRQLMNRELEVNLNNFLTSLQSVNGSQIYDLTKDFVGKFYCENEEDENELIRKVKEEIKEHLSESINVTSLAQKVFVSPNYLSRLFHQVTGERCSEYISRKKIELAIQLLETTNLKVGEISDLTGYQNLYYFSLAFKKRTGFSPTNYRRKAALGKKTQEGENE